jgi:hypothetical protein
MIAFDWPTVSIVSVLVLPPLEASSAAANALLQVLAVLLFLEKRSEMAILVAIWQILRKMLKKEKTRLQVSKRSIRAFMMIVLRETSNVGV